MAFDRLSERLPQGCLLTAALLVAAMVGYGFATYLPIGRDDLGKGWGQLLLLGCLLCLLIAWRLLKRQRRADRQIQQLLQAVENDDTAFRFPETTGSAADRSLHQNLNRIRALLAEAKQNTIQQEKYYSLILETVHTGVLVVGDEGTIYQHNREALRLFEREVLTHLDQLKANPLLAQRLREARAGETFQTACHLSGEQRQLLVRVSEITLKGQRLRIFTFNDIHTALDEREMDTWIRLIRVLTHEIMNSVTPIASLSETLLPLVRSECHSAEIPEGLEAICHSSKGLLAFVENYRRFTRIPTPQPALFYVKPFLTHALKVAEHQAAATSSITFRLQVEPEDLLLYADEALITQVVNNLLKNAEEALAGQPQGEIRVRAYADSEESIYIEIANNGPAISPEVAANLFIPFFTTKAEGSGIGLSLSRQLMRLSGGSLTLLSASPVTFRMKFV